VRLTLHVGVSGHCWMDGEISGDGGGAKRKKQYVGVCVVEGASVAVRFPWKRRDRSWMTKL
jgi:hypothetical protein